MPLEPLRWWEEDIPAVAACPPAAVAACPPALSALELARTFGQKEKFWLADATVHFAQNGWVAVYFGKVRGRLVQCTGVDLHCTMTYLRSSVVDCAEQVAWAIAMVNTKRGACGVPLWYPQ